MKSFTVLLASLFLFVAAADAEDTPPQSGRSSSIVAKDHLVVIGLATEDLHTVTVLDTETMEVYSVRYQAGGLSTKKYDWTFQDLKKVKEAETKKTAGKK